MAEVVEIAAALFAAFVGFTIAGVAGFGGGVVTLPVLVWAFGIREAIPILAIAQIIGSFSRIGLNRDAIDWQVVKWFALGSIPTAVVGSLMFISAPTSILSRVLGGAMLLIAVWSMLPKAPRFTMKLWGFAPVGAVMGMLSAALGVPGPFAVAFYLAYGLAPGAYIGTSSLGMMIIQIPKLAVFGASDLLGLRVLVLGLALGLVAFFASYFGQLVRQRAPQRLFPVVVNVMLIISGLLLVVRG